jgi:hypothetical protein
LVGQPILQAVYMIQKSLGPHQYHSHCHPNISSNQLDL